MRKFSFILAVALLCLSGCSRHDDNRSADDGGFGSKPGPGGGVCMASAQSPSRPSLLGVAPEFSVPYQRADGSTWIRHGRIETVDSRRLLLVVDEPTSGDALQTVVFRKSFDASELAELEAAVELWQNPALAQTTFAFQAPAVLFLTNNPIWPVTRQWDAAAEADYNNWVHTQVEPSLLVGTGINVDCADFAITIRWIYAHDHGLPAAGTLEGSGRLFGSWQSSAAWDRLPTNSDWRKDERFKAALKYILSNSQTHSIVADLYPVAITPAYITPGTIYLTWHEATGHTRTYLSVGSDPSCGSAPTCFTEIYGNLPKSEYAYVMTYETPQRQDEGKGGLMRFRWPVSDAAGKWKLAASESMPGFSREQYAWSDIDFAFNLGDRLNLYSSREELVANLASGLWMNIFARYSITLGGYYLCSLVSCAPGSDLDEEWSTPSRDSRSLDSLANVRALLGTVDGNSPWISGLATSLSQPFDKNIPISVWDLIQSPERPKWDSNPRADFAARWALPPMSPEARARMLAQIMFGNWTRRESRVFDSVYRCTKTKSPTCKPGTPAWKTDETSRLDQAFRIALKDFKKLYGTLPSNDRSSVDDVLKSMTTSVPYCDGGCANPCTMYDYVIAHPERLVKMTSDPRDTQTARFGF